MILPTVISQPGTSLRSLTGAFVLTKLTEGESPRTIEFYSENLRRFVWYAENQNWPQDIDDITQCHIKAFLGYVAIEKARWGLTGNGSETSHRRASQATVRHYYNYRRYHEGLGDVTPYAVYTGRHLEIIQKRKDAKSKTLAERTIIESPESRVVASKVSFTSKAHLVPLSLPTYIFQPPFYFLFSYKKISFLYELKMLY